MNGLFSKIAEQVLYDIILARTLFAFKCSQRNTLQFKSEYEIKKIQHLTYTGFMDG